MIADHNKKTRYCTICNYWQHEGMENHELTDWLQLATCPRLPNEVVESLCRKTQTAKAILAQIAGSAKPLPEQTILKALQWREHPQHHILTLADDAFPRLLKEIPNPPLLLYISGNIAILNHPQIAMVGSRNPTPSGAEHAYQFARDLTEAGLYVTSGLAIGIDGASHKGAVDLKQPTIAVLGSGLNHIYPRRHQALANAIIDHGGALVSMFPLDSPPKKHHFPMRNRIISGLSLGTFVVEAALKSGSLITARFAGEQGRDVYALPSSIHNPLAKGCHHLIKQGAKMVETLSDILEEIPGMSPQQIKSPTKSASNAAIPGLDCAQRKLLECVEFSGTTTERIIARSGLPTPDVLAMLVNLQMYGYITPTYGGYSRVK